MDVKYTYYHTLSSVFLWIYRPMHRTDSFIVDGSDLGYGGIMVDA